MMVAGHNPYKRLKSGQLMEQATVPTAANDLKAIDDICYLPLLSSILDSPHLKPAT